jgi:hypothetical protein
MSSYYVYVQTGEDYSPLDYDAAAGRLAGMFVTLFSDHEVISSLTGGTERTGCHTDVEVCLEGEPRELCAKAVIDIQAKCKFDKGYLSKMLKSHPVAEEWPNMKVAKKAVPS